MDEKMLREYKKQLEEDRRKLIKEVKKDEKPEDFGSDVDDFDEEKNEAEALGNQLAVSQAIKERVNEIDAALNKIRMGKYGICEKCGRQIGVEVLKVSPESRLCKNCKKSMM